MDTVISKNGVPIRIPEKRWFHVTEEHSEIAGCYFEVLETISEPKEIFKGNSGELLAVKEIESGKFIVAIYKEASDSDGFLITSFFTRKINKLRRREKIWPR